MSEFLYQIDLSIFNFLNHTISNPIFDKFFPFITNPQNWILLYITFWLLLIFKNGRIGKISAIGIILLLAISDQLSSHFLKPLIGRVRPCNALDQVNLLVNCTKSYSMPSSHAVNNFAAAIFFGRIFPKYKVVLLTIASLVAVSRPIVGVHYFSDIIVGGTIGTLLGYIMSVAALKLDNYFEDRLRKKNEML